MCVFDRIVLRRAIKTTEPQSGRNRWGYTLRALLARMGSVIVIACDLKQHNYISKCNAKILPEMPSTKRHDCTSGYGFEVCILFQVTLYKQ